ncbi:MAG: TetR/AcrR family transcriptional regulator [Nitrososphaeraceae archaeon]|jgi:AcrR family transcriptional regulator|nr:TetR/AcrR family transcriptional regulator [Nitrososphaeraceae archaeon]MDW0172093.1 TetR/AcrR family transcriptional regulator [Nitrososphaeraceae archaeon]MDW0185764.1 TetR/AcrR family transcriptional regulator [Nitrososphaeraceae archaeon]MDW0192484.1 TetR/AcrR family transcriptional regulator [Nitrososphaeraceae archaeon]MDW0200657.1 TetR/AcrR family transcriptional regulator [Nitrososphaeraceae archaeon]
MCPKVSTQYKIDVKEKIVNAALMTFSKYGYDRTRMDDVAEAAKVSKGRLYLYFKNKEELFYAISERNIAELKQQLSTLFTGKENLKSSSENFYENFRSNNTTDLEKVFFEIIAESSRNLKLRKMLYEQRIKIFDVVIEYLNSQMQRGLIKKGTNTKAIASGLVSLYNGLSLSRVLGISETLNKQTWLDTVRAIFNAIS